MIDFEALRKAEEEATPGPWHDDGVQIRLRPTAVEPRGFPAAAVRYEPDAALLALARNLYLPLLAVAEAAERVGVTWTPSARIYELARDETFVQARGQLWDALAALAEAAEREQA